MLQSIRDRLTGPIVWFIIGLICIPFAFWGIESYNSGGGDPVVAKVGSQEITQSQLETAYRQRYQQFQSMLGDQFRADMIDPARFRQTILDNMVQEAMLQQYARENGYRAGDAALIGYLTSIPAFQKDGKFSPEQYRDLLARQNMRPEQFEQEVRDSLVIDQLRATVLDTAIVTDRAAADAYRLARQKRRVKVASLPVSRYAAAVQVSDEDLKAAYEQQKSRFMSPERIKLSYVVLDRAALEPAGDPGDDVLRVIYDAERATQFASEEERKARHVLIAFGADKAAAKEKAESIVQQLRQGADFATLAKQQSDDTGSKAQGGELGWVRRGMMVPSFEEALFKLKPGEISDPVESQFGWHVIQLEDVRAAEVKPFEDPEVRSRLIELYRSREADRRFTELNEQIEALAFENPNSLEPVAKAIGAPVQTTDWFSRGGGAGIAADPAVQKAAFAPELIDDGENSKPIALSDGRTVVIRKAEYEPAAQRPFEDVAPVLKSELQRSAAAKQAEADAEAVLAAIRDGRAWGQAIAEKQATQTFDGELTRQTESVDPAIASAAFSLPRPVEGQPSATKVTLSSGDVALVMLEAVDDPAAPPDSDPDLRRLKQQMRDAAAGAEFAALAQELRKEMEVDVKAAAIAQPSRPGP